MKGFASELRIAARSLLKSPGFSIVAVLTLALGIGATTTLFSVVHGVLLRPLPYADSHRIVQLFQMDGEGNRMHFSDPNFQDVREQSRSFSAMAQMSGAAPVSVLGGAEPARAVQMAASRDFLDVLGVGPLHGRRFVEEEMVEGGAPAVIVGHSFWEQQLGGRTDLAGLSLSFGGRLHSVVGVLPPALGWPADVDLITPRELDGPGGSRTAHNWAVIARLADGATVESASRELSAIAARLERIHRDETWMSAGAVVPLRERLVGDVRKALLVLLGASALLLIIAAANVTNLLLARAAGRRREHAIRVALGAGRSRLLYAFLAEALVLAPLACGLGVLIAVWSVDGLRLLAPASLPRVDEIRVDASVLAFAVIGSILTAFALALVTSFRAAAGDLRASLVERSGGGGARRGHARALLVSGQMALTLILLVGATLLGRSFFRLLATDPGYRTGGAAVVSLALDYPESDAAAARQVRLHDELMQRLAAIPGVRNVGGVSGLPHFGGFGGGTFLLLERPDEVASFEDFSALSRIPSRSGYAEYRVASGGYFQAMGVPLLRGRTFDERDHVDAPHVAVVSESLARQTWPGEDPLGKLVQFGNMDGDLRPFTVVGVVGDVREGGGDREAAPIFYGNSRQRIGRAARFDIVVHGSLPPEAILPGARAAVRDLAPEVPPRLRTLDEIFARSLAQRRFSLLLFGVFGASALVLAMMGLYGVVAYTVQQRTHEIGVRLALGATGTDVTRLLLRQGARLAIAGAAAGLVASFLLTGLIRGLLFEVTATDPATFAGVTVLLIAVALLASYVPARRATRVDPISALRTD